MYVWKNVPNIKSCFDFEFDIQWIPMNFDSS